ncbi:pimeloyl-ACP methyl ester carboxylesterase [Micromonospora luteifusca]|uniref:Pimeloyl-ACP methyl ester carboxylesterase n=1 Tax=Micromonospora luteifusca TaxID=709860 RepID=A0ABS2M405_9ACTN|nr:hypothetical protein [Micromonospora luteifusca]MBM7494979.1 pimeloyl-ACP methyl ester carboxylesterase [Micromonospora luteifusca]
MTVRTLGVRPTNQPGVRDRTTAPELERFLAERMDATTIEVDSSHLAMVTHPEAIADLILMATRGARGPVPPGRG